MTGVCFLTSGMRKLILLLIFGVLTSCGNDQSRNVNSTEVKQESQNLERDTAGISGDLVIYQPSKNAKISSPLEIRGKARGSWYFEGQFPFELVTQDNKIIVQGTAKADADWMTEEFVPFSAEVKFETGDSEEGSLIFRRSNPSGLPENDKFYRLPVYFK